MIVLIAPEQDIENELSLLDGLFQNGLMVFHLRKPEKSKPEMRAYLKQINSDFLNRVVLHQYHELADEFPLKGIHLQEQKRRDFGEQLREYIIGVKAKNEHFTVSSSFHEIDELEACKVEFDYHLLSPVFSSISKEGYEGRGFDVSTSSKKIIGMGGVNEQTVQRIHELGFKGIGVLGGVWNAEDTLSAFKNIKSEYEKQQ